MSQSLKKGGRRQRSTSARASELPAAPAPEQSRFAWTAKQWLFFEAVTVYVDRGQPFTLKQIAADIRIQPTTISIWNRDERFLREYARRLRVANDPEVELAIRAMLKAAQRGNTRAFESAMRALGRFDVIGEPRRGAATMREMSEPRARGSSTTRPPAVSPRLKTPTRYGSKTELGLMVENLIREGIDRTNRARTPSPRLQTFSRTEQCRCSH